MHNNNIKKIDKYGQIDLKWYAKISINQYKQNILDARKNLGFTSK